VHLFPINHHSGQVDPFQVGRRERSSSGGNDINDPGPFGDSDDPWVSHVAHDMDNQQARCGPGIPVGGPVEPRPEPEPEAKATGTDRATSPVRLGASGTGSAARVAAVTRNANTTPATRATPSTASTALPRARRRAPVRLPGIVTIDGLGARCRPTGRRADDPAAGSPSTGSETVAVAVERFSRGSGHATAQDRTAAATPSTGAPAAPTVAWGGDGTHPDNGPDPRPVPCNKARARADKAPSRSRVRAMPGRYAARSPPAQARPISCGQWDDGPDPCG
jgi:hypothetical protein